MVGSTTPVLLINLQPDDPCGQLTVSLGSYLRFADELSVRTDELVNRWRHKAPPRALLESVWDERDALAQG